MKLYKGQNLKLLHKLKDNSIDLIYIDPPFFSQATYKNKEGEICYKDRFKSLDAYIDFMKERLIEAHRVLKDTGSICLHCDHHASHHLRVLLEKVFGVDNFVNEIIWCYQSAGGSKKKFNNWHQTILVYSKTKNYKYEIPKEQRSEKSLKRMKNPKGARVDKTKIEDWDKRTMTDYWTDIPIAKNCPDDEYVGYPTQKPLKLLNRIITTFTNKDDIVLDFFCGSGTTLSSAQGLGRKWIGCDNSEEAIEVVKKRMLIEHNLKIREICL